MDGRGQHLLRKGRVSEVGRIYHVTMVCHKRRRIFADWVAGRCVVRALMAVEDVAATLAYVVMPDHVHWLMQLESGGELSAIVQKVKSLASKALARGGVCGAPVWQRGFHDRALRNEDDVVDVARYVVANPLRAGIVRSVREYPLWDACWL